MRNTACALTGLLLLLISSASHAQSNLENPKSDSFQSGIGLISGWSCDSDDISITVDGLNPVSVAYGTSRGDVASVCGSSGVGFGLTINWNLYGDGPHTVQAYADGVQFASANVTVTTLGLGEFPRGLVGEFALSDFPQAGEKTVVVWQESKQNFAIKDVQGGSAPSPMGIWSPSPGTSWQWQLQGTIDTSFDVDMYDIDLFDTPQAIIDELHAANRIVVCYFSAGTWEDFRSDAGDFPASVRGTALGDFPDELWLDIRQLDVLGPIMRARLDMAASKNCDGVEPDNVTAFNNDSGFPITAADQLAYNIWLATEAHNRGLSIGLKNDLDQIQELEPHFDWALNEQCFEFDECDLLLPFIEAGKAVFGVEYSGDSNIFCPKANSLNFDWLLKDLDLRANPYLACRNGV